MLLLVVLWLLLGWTMTRTKVFWCARAHDAALSTFVCTERVIFDARLDGMNFTTHRPDDDDDVVRVRTRVCVRVLFVIS